jgi:hypothetical protein
MSSALELLELLEGIGATVKPAGDRLILHAGPKPIPGALVRHLREAKSDILAALAGKSAPSSNGIKPDATWWRSQLAIGVINRELGGTRKAAQAQHLAFGDIVVEWHRRYGEPPDSRCCAGCGFELGDSASAIVLSDGARVHLGGVHGADCLIRYGWRWREAAMAALARLGINPPQGFTR